MSDEKPELTNYIRMRWKAKTGSLVFYADKKGAPPCGIKECDETKELRALVEKVYGLSAVIPEDSF